VLLLLFSTPAEPQPPALGASCGPLGLVLPFSPLAGWKNVPQGSLGGALRPSSGWGHLVMPFSVWGGWQAGLAAGDDGDTAEGVSPTRRGLFRGRNSRR
jgi:hypothetical protein